MECAMLLEDVLDCGRGGVGAGAEGPFREFLDSG